MRAGRGCGKKNHKTNDYKTAAQGARSYRCHEPSSTVLNWREPQTKLRPAETNALTSVARCVASNRAKSSGLSRIARKHACASTRLRPAKALSCHESRTATSLAMSALVLLRSFAAKAIGQRKRLPKRQTQAFSRDGIHAARSIAE